MFEDTSPENETDLTGMSYRGNGCFGGEEQQTH